MKAMVEIGDDINTFSTHTSNVNLEQFKKIDEIFEGNLLQAKSFNSRLKTLDAKILKTASSNIIGMENIINANNLVLTEQMNRTQKDILHLESNLDDYQNNNNITLKKINVDSENNTKDIYTYIDNKFKEMNNKLQQNIDETDKANKKEIKEMKEDVQDMVVRVNEVAKLDPNSKQLQKIINTLSNKVQVIDSHFSFSVSNKNEVKNIKLPLSE